MVDTIVAYRNTDIKRVGFGDVCGTSKNPTIGNDIKRVGFWEVVLGKFHKILKKD